MKLSDLLVPSTKFSKFRCDTYKKFSANPGILYPVWFNLLNPGESASIDLRSVIRTWPVESPLMGSMKVRFVTAAFNLKNYSIALEGYKRSFDWRSVRLPWFRIFYPKKDLFSDYSYTNTYKGSSFTWRDDMYNPEFGNPYEEVDISYNVAQLCRVSECSLADYLGYEPGWIPTDINYPTGFESNIGNNMFRYISKSFVPFLCYYDFYRNYLINPQESTFPMFISMSDVVKKPKSDETADAEYWLTPVSYVRRFGVSQLDNLIENCHKYYDGDSVQPINSSSSGVYSNWFNLFRWQGSDIDVTPDFAQIGIFPKDTTQMLNTFSSVHGGLVSTMFDSDINTQWLSVDNFDKLNEVRINTQTESGATYSSFSDIVKASSLWDFITKSINSDGTYGDFIGNQFGVTVKGDFNIPQIVHVYDTLLSFDDITSQSDTVTAPGSDVGAVVGQQFGVGRSFGQSNHFKVINKDGNYIMLMTFMWATPQVCYHGGVNHLNNITKFSNLYQPSFDNYAMQARLQEQVKSAPIAFEEDENLNVSIVPYLSQPWQFLNTNVVMGGDSVLGYQPAWSDYKTDIDVVHGLFHNQLSYYTIIRDVLPISTIPALGIVNNSVSSYVYSGPTNSQFTRAIDAQRYQLPFAVDTEDCMQVQLRVGCTITRAMSKNVNPNIK